MNTNTQESKSNNKYALLNDDDESFLDSMFRETKDKLDNSILTKEMFKDKGFTTGRSNPALKNYLLGQKGK